MRGPRPGSAGTREPQQDQQNGQGDEVQELRFIPADRRLEASDEQAKTQMTGRFPAVWSKKALTTSQYGRHRKTKVVEFDHGGQQHAGHQVSAERPNVAPRTAAPGGGPLHRQQTGQHGQPAGASFARGTAPRATGGDRTCKLKCVWVLGVARVSDGQTNVSK